MNRIFSLPGLLWILLSATCLIIILLGLKRVLKETNRPNAVQQRIFYGTTVLLLLWAVLLCAMAYNGFFSDFNKLPPRPALALFFPLPFILFFAFSNKGMQLLEKIPGHWLIYIQSFRVPVELLLWNAFLENKLPVQMTFGGGNVDIITGILALPAGYLLMRQKKWAKLTGIAFNIIGILLLLNILVIAVLSMPTPFRYFMNEPSNTLVAQFPYILLPGILVPIAYSFHTFSLRKLLMKK